MAIECPSCGKILSNDKYFCDVCGEALFAREPSVGEVNQPQGRGSHDSMRAGPPGTDGRIPTQPVYRAPPPRYPSSQLDYPYFDEKMYGGKPGFPWRKAGIIAVTVVAVIMLGLILWWFSTPSVKVEPPPGWVVAEGEDKDTVARGLSEENPGEVLDQLYLKEGSTSLEEDRIYISHADIDMEDDFPADASLLEMEQYIESMKESLSGLGYEYDKYIIGQLNQDMQAIYLDCGQVGIYAKYNPGGFGSLEEIIVRKKNTIYLIVVIVGYSPSYPSQEIEHFRSTIDFE